MRLRVLSLSTADRPALYFSVNKASRISSHRGIAFSCIYNVTCSSEVRYVVSVHRSVEPVVMPFQLPSLLRPLVEASALVEQLNLPVKAVCLLTVHAHTGWSIRTSEETFCHCGPT